jgi:hypothetical protein
VTVPLARRRFVVGVCSVFCDLQDSEQSVLILGGGYADMAEAQEGQKVVELGQLVVLDQALDSRMEILNL